MKSSNTPPERLISIVQIAKVPALPVRERIYRMLAHADRQLVVVRN